MTDRVSFLPPYISPRPLSRLAIGLLLAMAGAASVSVGIDLSELALVSGARGGELVSPEERWAQYLANAWIGWLELALFLAAATAFLAWLFQARVNLRAFGVRRLRFARVWSVAGFLVPVLNLVRPYQVVQEVWQASDPASADAFNWKSLRVPQLLRVWWIAALGCAGLQLLAFLVGLGTNAVALIVAAALLDGFGIGKVTFPVLVVIFTVVSMVVTLLVDSIVRRHAQAAVAGIGLISSFLTLLLTDLITDKLTVEGAWAWIVGTVLVWLASLVVRPFLRGFSNRRAQRRRT